MDRFEQMRAFAAIVEAGGFSRASERLGLSRAALSKQLRQLEDRLSVRLLHRTTRRVSATEAGRRFYSQCRRVLDDVAAAEESVAPTGIAPRGELRVIAPTNFGLAYLGAAITQFLLTHGDLTIDLSLSDRPIDPIESGHDLAIRVVNTAPPNSTSLAATRLSVSRRILCAAPAYLAARGTPMRPAELAAHDCLSYSYVEDPRCWRFKKAGKDYAATVSGRIVTSAGQVLRTAALTGLGIAYGPIIFFREDMEAGRLSRVLADYDLPTVSIYSLYPVGRHASPKVRAFNEFMRTFFADKFL